MKLCYSEWAAAGENETRHCFSNIIVGKNRNINAVYARYINIFFLYVKISGGNANQLPLSESTPADNPHYCFVFIVLSHILVCIKCTFFSSKNAIRN